MAVDNRLLKDLHRLFLNGKLREVKRGGEDGLMLLDAPLSAQWLQLGEAFPHHASEWEQATAWQAILRGIARVASIIYGPQQLQIVFDRYDQNYQYKPDRSVIVVSTEPALSPPSSPGFTIYDAVDAMTGQVIHEAGHIRERVSDTPVFPDDPILSLLHHLVEDAVNDQILALEYPGFEGYLLAFRNYYVDWKLRNNWGFRAEGRLKQLILAMRSTWPDRISRWSVRHAYLYLLYRLTNARSIQELRRIDKIEVAGRLHAILYDARHAEHWSEPDVLSESFVLGMEGPPVQGDKGNNRGGKELKPITRSVLEQLDCDAVKPLLLDEEDEPKSMPERLSGRRAWQKVGRWADEFRHEADRRNSQALTDEMRVMLHQRIEEDRERVGGAEGDYEAELARLPLHAQAAKRYRAAVDAVRPQIVLLRNALADVNAGRGRDDFALCTGSDLDEEALYRAKFAVDLFKRPSSHAHRTAPLDFALMIDASYSMKEPLEGGGDLPKYVAAQRLAALFVEALEPLADMRAWVFSYSSQGRKTEIHDLYSPSAGADRARIGDLYPAHQTPEFQALLAVSRHIRDKGRQGVKKIYLVLSDGLPSDDAVPRERQITEISRLARQLEAGGDTVIHLAISSHGGAAAMYPHRLAYPVEGYPALIRRFSRLLERLILQ